MDPIIVKRVLFVAFIVLAGVIGYITSKKRNTALDQQAEERYSGKKAAGDDEWFLTTDHKVVWNQNTQAKHIVTEINLYDIAYVMEYTEGGVPHIAFYDSTRKLVPTVVLYGAKEKKGKAHFLLAKKHPDIYGLVKAGKPDIMHADPFFKNIEG